MSDAPRAPRFNRRSFLGLGLVVAVPAVTAALGVRSYSAASYDGLLLRYRLHYLNFSRDVLAQFLAAYSRDPRPLAAKRASIHLNFLLSTDFFQNGADESRALSFTAYPNPYDAPCNNPFASTV